MKVASPIACRLHVDQTMYSRAIPKGTYARPFIIFKYTQLHMSEKESRAESKTALLAIFDHFDTKTLIALNSSCKYMMLEVTVLPKQTSLDTIQCPK